MLTIFTIPKPFKDHIGIIQGNALRSWRLLRPACEIILCGNDPGVKEAAIEFGVSHLPDIARNEFGTPLLNSTFEEVMKKAQFPILCYVNADIILLNDLMEAIKHIPLRPFMAIGQRTNVDILEPLDFENPGWRSTLGETVTSNGELLDVNWIDCFVFTPNGALEKLPPFAVGRPNWDNWFIYHARELDVPVVDFTRACRVIHQNHDYSHVPQREGNFWDGPEAKRNQELMTRSMGESGHLCNIDDATHILTRRGLLPALGERYLRRRWYTAALLHPVLKPVADGLRPFFQLRRRIIDGLGKKIKRRSSPK